MQASLDIKDYIREYTKPIFLAYDKDHSSTLQKNELRQLLADGLGVDAATITQDQLDWHFDKIDENHDGKITFEEYFGHFFGQRAIISRKESQKEKVGEKADSNDEDDLIDIAEFRRLMEDTFRPLKIEITQEMVQWNFNQIDVDHSGRITFEEYMKFIRKYNP